MKERSHLPALETSMAVESAMFASEPDEMTEANAKVVPMLGVFAGVDAEEGETRHSSCFCLQRWKTIKPAEDFESRLSN